MIHHKLLISGLVFFILLALPSHATDVVIVPNGSIIGTLSVILCFFIYVASKFFKLDSESEHKPMFSLIGSIFIGFGVFIMNLMTFFIMKFSEDFTYFGVARAIFVIFSVISLATLLALIPIGFLSISYFLKVYISSK